MTLSVLGYIASIGKLKSDMEGCASDVIEVVYWHLSGGSKKHHRRPQCLGLDLYWVLPEFKRKALLAELAY